jgi:hypothetical protein
MVIMITVTYTILDTILYMNMITITRMITINFIFIVIIFYQQNI